MADSAQGCKASGCAREQQSPAATYVEHLFVAAPVVQREHPVTVVEFADLHVEEKEAPFEKQQGRGPKQHGSR